MDEIISKCLINSFKLVTNYYGEGPFHIDPEIPFTSLFKNDPLGLAIKCYNSVLSGNCNNSGFSSNKYNYASLIYNNSALNQETSEKSKLI